MANVTILMSTPLCNGAQLISAHVTGTDNYNRTTGDMVSASTVGASANAVIMVHPTGPSNGGIVACWSNAMNALLYYGLTNLGALGPGASTNGQPMIGVGNAVNMSTHTFPALIIVKP